MEEDKDFLIWCDEYDRFQFLKIMYQFKRMYERNKMCDFIIKSSDGKEFHVHKLMICASIPYFHSFKDFANNCNKNENTVTLDMFSSETIELILDYIYNGKMEYHKDTVLNIVYAADYLQMESLKNKAIENLFYFGDKNTLFNEKVFFCIESSIARYQEAQKFYGKNFLEFSEKESFYLLGIQSLISILDKDYLNVPNEEFVFNSAMKWMYHDLQNRKQYILDIFPILRIAYLDYSFLINKILTEPTIINIGEVKDKIIEYLGTRSENTMGNKYLIKFSPERNSYKFKCLVYDGSYSGNTISIEIRNYHQKYKKWVSYSSALFEKTDYVLGIKYNNNVYFIQYLNSRGCYGGVILDMDNCSTKEVSFSDYRYGRALTHFKDKIFSFGGIDNEGECEDLVECYSFKDKNSTSLKPMANGVREAASVIFNNSIYIIGGKLGDEAIPNVQKYSICRNVWEDIHPMSYLRCNASAIVYNNRIFVIGGKGLESQLNSCEVYDIEVGVWSDIPDMPYKRAGASLSIKNDFLYVVGGVGEKPNQIMKYNLHQSTWHEGPLLEDSNLRYIAI
uniref:BTB domain-containing protein n=1 Tax=Strongyloides stercoralis TaxID=6248 RepID=A0A0K0E1L9_STRER